MPKLRRLAGRDVVTILQGFGFQQVSQRGSHIKLVRAIAEWEILGSVLEFAL